MEETNIPIRAITFVSSEKQQGSAWVVIGIEQPSPTINDSIVNNFKGRSQAKFAVGLALRLALERVYTNSRAGMRRSRC